MHPLRHEAILLEHTLIETIILITVSIRHLTSVSRD